MIGVVSAMEVMVVKGAAKAALAVSTGIAENGSSSNDMFAVDLNKNIPGHSSAKATLSRNFAEIGEENASKDTVSH